jgi:hypothetical protein
MDRQSFHISNWVWSRKGSICTFEMVTARERGSIVHRNEDGDAMIVADHMDFPNGLGTSYDGQLLYLASSQASVLICKRLPDGKLILRDRMDTLLLAGNLRVSPVDDSFLIASKQCYLYLYIIFKLIFISRQC